MNILFWLNNHRADVPKNEWRQWVKYDKIHESDSVFFGYEPSHFATFCLTDMKTDNVKKLLELGEGHGRDSIFLTSNGIQVKSLDYSTAGVE